MARWPGCGSTKCGWSGRADLGEGASVWVDRVRAIFAWKPLRIGLGTGVNLRAAIRESLLQAKTREMVAPGHANTMLRHIVQATLDCALKRAVRCESSWPEEACRFHIGDFLIGDVVIHATTSPGEAVIAKCRDNLDDGLHPILITVERGLAVAEGLASNAGLADRIDVFEIEQFVALNLYELGKFGAEGRRTAVADLVDRYNEIVDEFETDPSLKIGLRR